MTIRVLSVDGGGIRGVGPANILCHLDGALSAAGKKPVVETFNLFVGTSTGCIVAAGLAADGQVAADLSPGGIKNLYYDKGAEIFTRELFGLNPFALFRGKYRDSSKGKVLRERLGALSLGELERNFLGTFYNVGAMPGPVFLNGGKEYREKGDNKTPDVPLWEVVNASSSAPIYFDPGRVTTPGHPALGADGGLFANNPAMCAYVEARKTWPEEDIVMVSLGCGHQQLRFPHRKHWGLLNWASPWAGMPLLEAMFDGQSQTVTYQMDRILGPGRFFRFDFSLDPIEPAKLDDTSEENLNAIVSATDQLLATPDGMAKLKAIVDAIGIE